MRPLLPESDFGRCSAGRADMVRKSGTATPRTGCGREQGNFTKHRGRFPDLWWRGGSRFPLPFPAIGKKTTAFIFVFGLEKRE